MHDILILGGGLVGASLACALENSGLRVGLVEASVPSAGAPGFNERKLALSAASLTARDYLEDNVFTGPKGLLVGLALHAAGRENLARVEWQACEALLRSRLRDNPRNLADQAYLATVVAGLALNMTSSLVKGLMPLCALTAGLRTVLIFMRPGRTNSPIAFFLM